MKTPIKTPVITVYVDDDTKKGQEQWITILGLGDVIEQFEIKRKQLINGKLGDNDRRRLLAKMRKRRATIPINPAECIGNEWDARTLVKLPIIETNDMAFPHWEIKRSSNSPRVAEELIKIVLQERKETTKRKTKTETKPKTQQNKIAMSEDTEKTITHVMGLLDDNSITDYVNELTEEQKMFFMLGWKLRHRVGEERRKTILSAISAANNVIRREITEDGRAN
jgi:hypothetical protein